LSDTRTEQLRNVGLMAHGGAGKTTLAEAMLFNAKASTRLGRVDDGNAIMDSDPDEMERKISISLALAHASWKNHELHIVDTPGYADFIGDVVSAVRVLDGAIIVVDATAGVEVGTERVWKYADEQSLPRLIFVNKMKKDNADFSRIVEMAREELGRAVTPIQLPIGKGDGFKGVIDLIKMKAYLFGDGKSEEQEIPSEMSDAARQARETLVESVAETDDALTEKYLEEGDLSAEEAEKGLRAGTINGSIVPLLCGDAYANQGVEKLLDGIVDLLPSPPDRPPIEGSAGEGGSTGGRERTEAEPLSALIFKTVTEPHVGELSFVRVFSGILEAGMELMNTTQSSGLKTNQIYLVRGKERKETVKLVAGQMGALVKLKDVRTGDTLAAKSHPIIFPPIDFPEPNISVAIVPKTKGDEEKVMAGLARLHEEDPTFSSRYDRDVKQMLISGLGELHLEVIVNRLKRKFGVEVDLVKPRIPYRETIRRKVERVEAKFKKQTGGRGQYGHVFLRLEPLERGAGFEFGDEIFGGAIPGKYVPAVQKGVEEAMREGVISNFPVVDLKAVVIDGSFHPVDSSDIAFKVAGSLAFKKGAQEAGIILLEPIMDVEVTVPEEYMGEVIGDLNSRRGRILGMDTEGHLQKIRATVPQAEMYKYSTNLRSMTQGKGMYAMRFSRYEEVPRETAEKVIAEEQAEKEA